MHPILAQADVGSLPANFLKEMIIFVVGAIIVMAFVCSALFAGLQYFLDKRSSRESQKREIHPIPLPVIVTEELHKQFAGREEFTTHKAEVKEGFQRVDRERSEDLRVAAVSRRTMYDKQDAMRKELSDRTDTVRRELGDKIEDIPDKVISTLRNAGAIGGKHD